MTKEITEKLNRLLLVFQKSKALYHHWKRGTMGMGSSANNATIMATLLEKDKRERKSSEIIVELRKE